MTTKLDINPLALEASILCDSFWDFVQAFWDTVIPEQPVWNWHIEYLCEELQILAERVIAREPKLYDLIINISPGSTKSTICSVMFPAWLWARDPSLRAICGSYAFPLSLHLSSQSRRILQSDKYRGLFPHVCLTEWSKVLIQNDKGGQRISTSTGGSITGMHGHILIVDDPINPKEALSKAAVQAANDWIDQTLMTRKVDRRITPTLLIMQRLHQNDPTGHLLEKRPGTIRHINLPAELDDDNKNDIRPRRLRHFYTVEPEGKRLMDPVRLSRQSLEDAKLELGEYAYAGQYRQSPIPAGGGMFRVDAMGVLAPGEVSGVKWVVRYWDKAGTSAGGAYTVGVKMGKYADGRFIVLNVIRGQWEAAKRERIIAQTAEIDGRDVEIGIEQEPGSGGKESAQNTLRRLAGFRVYLDRPTGSKELRADPFAAQLNAGNVSLMKGPWNAVYLEELRFFPFSTYKDQVDGSSGAFARLVKRGRVVGAFR